MPTHTTSVTPMPANENGRGNLAGHKATCSCGWVATTSMGHHTASLDAQAHVRYAQVAKAQAMAGQGCSLFTIAQELGVTKEWLREYAGLRSR